MKKLFLLTKTLLVATLLMGGANFAWGDGTKRVLYSEDFEDATTPAAVNWSGHSDANVAISTNSSYTAYGKFISGWPNGSGNRSMGGTLSFSSTGYSTSAMTSLGYVIEFDALLKGGMQINNSKSELILPYSKVLRSDNNTYYDESTAGSYLFAISQSNTTGNFEKTWYINDLSNSTGSTATLDYDIFYHWKFVVTKTSVEYTISAAGKEDITGSKTLSDLDAVPLAKQVYMLLGRNSAWFLFDNIEIYDYTDEEVVSTPSIANPVYAGANRTVTVTAATSSKGNSVTTYYTTDGTAPSASNYAGSFTTATKDVTITSNCTLKAITISSTGEQSSIVEKAVTVGKLTLNAPTFTKTAYSAGYYTYTIATDQSSLEFVPASTTIKYRVGSAGDFATYSSTVSVPAGDILYAYAEADNYTASSTSEVCAVVLPAMTKAFGQNYVDVVDADLWMAVSAGPTVTNAKSTSDPNYFIPSNDGGTSALTNENISFYFTKHSTDDSQDKKWGLKTTGMYANYTRGFANVKIDNLTVGQIVEVSASAINSVTGLTELTTYSYGTTHYYVTTATTAYLNIARQQYVYSINVYDLDNEVVGAMDYTTDYYKAWNTTPIWINAGETAYYKFKNYNNGGNVLYQNWYLYGATEASENVVIFGPNHSNTGGAYTSKPTFTNADLNGTTVELTTTLTDAGNGTYTLTTTGVTTKADGSTKLSPNLVYQQTGLTVSKLKLYVSVEKSWLALQEEAVKKNIAIGYATYFSNNALDFANATPALTASIITGSTAGVLTEENVDNVPAETGVLLTGDNGTYTIPVIASSSTSVTGNKLEGVHTATLKDANSIYILMNENNVPGFYKNNRAFTVGANTAYLPADFADITARSAYFFGGITGVDNVEAASEAEAKDGKFIENGKLVIVKNGQKYNAAGQQVK